PSPRPARSPARAPPLVFGAGSKKACGGIYGGGFGGWWRLWRVAEDRPCLHQPPSTSTALHRLSVRISSNSASARGSSDWPSQNSAFLRTPGLGWVRATRIRPGPPAARGCWGGPTTALSLPSAPPVLTS